MRLLPLATAFALLAAPAMAQSPAFPSEADLLALIKSRVDDGRATGLVLGVMEADGKTRIVSYGDAGPGAKPLGPDSVFEIGSITKVFTATILAGMAQKGEVKLDDPAQTYAPAGMTLPKRGARQITLANLSEQNSGLPRLPTNMSMTNPANPYADYTTAQLNDFLAHYQLPREIGEKFEYSNLGVGVLGNLLANKAGKPYETLVQERVLKPLRMTMTGITLTPQMQAALAKGHGPAGELAANWDLPTLAGAGALRSNMTDMLKFLAANIGEPKNDLERAMRLAHQPRFKVSDGTQIGLNWFTVTTKSGAQFVFHDGGTGGYGSFIAFDPKRQVGLVLLGNRMLAPEDIAMHLMDPTIPLTPKPAPPKQRTAIDVPAETLALYAGVYTMDGVPTVKLTVTLENGGLFVQVTAQARYPIFAEGPVDFFYKITDAQLTFTPAANGKPAYLVLHQGGLNQKATRLP